MISIVTVTHQSSRHMTDYVSSFLSHHTAEERRQVEFIVVENSADPSAELYVQQLRDAGCRATLKWTTNRGFGAGCNEGASLASGTVLAFVNPDVRFTSCIVPIASAFGDTHWGTVRQLSSDRGGTYAFDVIPECKPIIADVLRFHRFAHLIRPLYRYYFPVGAFFIVPRKLFMDVGGFDERFFMYYEEAELARRLHDRRGQPRYLSTVTIIHEGFGSQSDSDTTLRHEARSTVLYGQIIQNPLFAQTRVRQLARLSMFVPQAKARLRLLKQAIVELSETDRAL